MNNQVNKNIKAVKFLEYIIQNDIKSFGVQTIDDEVATAIFRTQIPVCGQTLPLIIIFDSEDIVTIRVRLLELKNTNKRISLYEIFNNMHAKYKLYKYYLQEDGIVYMDMYMPVDNESFSPKLLHMLLNTVVKNLEEVFPDIMYIIWGDKNKEQSKQN